MESENRGSKDGSQSRLSSSRKSLISGDSESRRLIVVAVSHYRIDRVRSYRLNSYSNHYESPGAFETLPAATQTPRLFSEHYHSGGRSAAIFDGGTR